MKSVRILTAALLSALLLAGCKQEASVEYVQRLLPEPASIVVSLGSTDLTYEPDSEQYRLLVDSLTPNWWKVQGERGLIDASSVKELKTTSDRTYRRDDDTFVQFLYPDTIQWTQDNGESIAIQAIVFLIPDAEDALLDVEGFFTISKTEEWGYNEGLFTYYYPAEMANGFWDYLLH